MSFSGLLNTTCTIELNTPAQDGSGQEIASWATAASSVPCRVDALTGGVTDTSDSIFDLATHRIFLENPSGVTITTQNHRIDISSVKYRILLVSSMIDFSGEHHLQLLTEVLA